MSTITDIIPLGKYADMTKAYSGNKIAEHYHETTGNVTVRDVYIPSYYDQGTQQYYIVPVLIPAGLTEEELMAIRFHCAIDDFTERIPIIAKPVTILLPTSEVPLYMCVCGMWKFGSNGGTMYPITFYYDPSTGIINVAYGDGNIMTLSWVEQELGIGETTPLNDAFNALYKVMIGTWEPTEDTEEGGDTPITPVG